MIGIMILLVILGLCLYLVETYIPMSAPIKVVLRVVVVLFIVVYLLNIFGLANIYLPRTR